MAQLDDAPPPCSIGEEDISDISIGELFEWSCKPKDGVMEMTKRFHSKQPNIKIIDSDNVRAFVNGKWVNMTTDDFTKCMLFGNITVLRAIRDFMFAIREHKLDTFGLPTENVPNSLPPDQKVLALIRISDVENRLKKRMNKSEPIAVLRYGKHQALFPMRVFGHEDFYHISFGEMVKWAEDPDTGSEAFTDKLHMAPCVPDNRNFEFFQDDSVRVYTPQGWARYKCEHFDSYLDHYARETLKAFLKLKETIRKGKAECFETMETAQDQEKNSQDISQDNNQDNIDQSKE